MHSIRRAPSPSCGTSDHPISTVKMPPQKRGRVQKSKATDDHSSGSDAAAERRAGGTEVEMMEDDSSDDDSDSGDDLTFAEKASDDDDEDDDDDDEDEDMEDADVKSSAKEGRNVNVEFVFSDPRESHFHSVKQFLIAYLPPTQPFNVSGLADAIVNQVTTGTMVCVEGEDDVYGFITALSLKRHQTENYMQQILQYATKKCPGDDLQRFQTILNTKSVGLLVNERMVNLPYQLVPAIHSALHEDIEWAIENEETAELRESFKFDYFLILSSCSIEKSGSAGGSGKGKGKKAKTQYDQTAKFFHNFEDEFLEQEAEVVFAFETPKSDRDVVDQTNKTTVVMLIERSKHKAALTSISSMINA